MHLGHERAGGVDHVQITLTSLIPDIGRDAVRAKDDGCAIRDFLKFLDKYDSFLDKTVNHVSIMDDFLSAVDRRIKGLNRQVYNVDRSVDSSAETARLCQDYL